MYSFLIKEINNEYTPKTIIENYKKILVSITPIIPHFSSECLKLLGEEKNLKWPEFDRALLEEEFVNIVIQVNGKKRGIIRSNKEISEKGLYNLILKDIKIKKYIEGKKIFKTIFVPKKLINIIIKND
mgnify:CR=1 FL=1